VWHHALGVIGWSRGGYCRRAQQKCRCPVDGIQPSVTILEEGADGNGPSRLTVPGCVLNSSWQQVQDEVGSDSRVYSCEGTVCGEAGAVVLKVHEHAAPGGVDVIPALHQTINILAGVPSSDAVPCGCLSHVSRHKQQSCLSWGCICC
jgi:hypothetical protein